MSEEIVRKPYETYAEYREYILFKIYSSYDCNIRDNNIVIINVIVYES